MMRNPLWSAAAPKPHARGAGDRRRRRVLYGITAGVALLAVAGDGWTAAGILRLRCTNPTSGATWPIVLDLDNHKVDSVSAIITDKWISWRDPKQGFFDLERATGKLQFRNASSTGGYFLYYTCRPE
jgi:hypothetical protein